MSIISRLREALNPPPPPSSTSLQEAYPSGHVDPDEHLYRRLSGSDRELNSTIQWRALKLAWQMYQSNPLAHGIIEMIKDHIVGEGFGYESDDEEVKEVLDKHWNDPQNLWDLKQHDKVRELSLFGEQMYIAFVNKVDGHVRLAAIDPINVREVWTNPENPEERMAILVNERLGLTGGAGGWQGDKVYRVIHEDTDPNSPTFGRLVGATEGETFHYKNSDKAREYDGSCFWFTVNGASTGRRGYSDLLSALDWLDIDDQVAMNFADRTLLMNNFIWDVTIEGASKAQIDAWVLQHSAPPRPATVRAHNEKEKWVAESPNFQRAEFEGHNKAIKSRILSAPGLPPHWFGDQEANRATAVEMGAPTYKRLASRQRFVKYMIEYILKFQLDQAIIAGRLKGYGSGDGEERKQAEFRLLVPEMTTRDMAAATTALLNTVNALTVAQQGQLIDDVEARRILVLIASQMGAEIDLDAMEERLEKLALEVAKATPKMTAKPGEGDEEDDTEEAEVLDEALAIVRRVSRNGHSDR